MNKKGFMATKFLAIIIILGMICFVFIPKLINYFSDKRKEEYIEVAREYIEEVKSKISDSSYKQIPKDNEALLVRLSSSSLKKKSPYGNFKSGYSYVIVVYNGEYFDYYFASVDSSNCGISIVNEKELTNDSIVCGLSNLTNVVNSNDFNEILVDNTLFKKDINSRLDDENMLLTPVSGELTVPYDFKVEVNKIYSDLVKRIDVKTYNKEVTINGGVLRYNNNVILDNYDKNINGMYRYLSFPGGSKEKYYSSFVAYTNNYVAGMINEQDEFLNKELVFDSLPSIILKSSPYSVVENNNKQVIWNLMAIYPDNDNYMITECGAIIADGAKTSGNITIDTKNALVGKSNNSCELGNIFAVRKSNVKKGDKLLARGYIKYTDKLGTSHIAYSNNTVTTVVD